MERADYLAEIREAYQGEVYGEALFRRAAELSPDPVRSRKWSVLARLEHETGARLRSLLEGLGETVRYDARRVESGGRHAVNLVALPWAAAMGAFLPAIGPVIERYEALERAAPPEEATVLGHLAAHERALEWFARLELDGRGRESLRPVLALLESPPAALDSVA